MDGQIILIVFLLAVAAAFAAIAARYYVIAKRHAVRRNALASNI